MSDERRGLESRPTVAAGARSPPGATHHPPAPDAAFRTATARERLLQGLRWPTASSGFDSKNQLDAILNSYEEGAEASSWRTGHDRPQAAR